MPVGATYLFTELDFPKIENVSSLGFGMYKSDSIAISINDNGHILGQYSVVATAQVTPTAAIPYAENGSFIFRNDEFDRILQNRTVFGGILPTKFVSEATSINNYDVVSINYSSFYPYQPSSVGTGINDAGSIVGGNDSFHAYLQGIQAIGVSPQTQDINNLNQTSYNSGGHGFITNGATTKQIDYPGSNTTTIYGINDVGQIVGTYTDVKGTHGFVDTRGEFAELTLPDGSDVTPYAINNLGQVVGSFQDGSGTHGFLANQVAPPGQNTISLHVSEDTWAYHPHAQFVVLVDGKQVGGVQSVTANHLAGQTQEVILPVNFTNAHEVEVQFLNDQYGGPNQDVNLYVDSLVFNGVTHTGSQAKANSSVAALDGSGLELFRNGSAVFNVAQSMLSLKVSGDAYQGDAQFIVMVDGRTVGGVQTAHASHAQGQSETITLQGDFNGAQQVAVQFINDRWDGTPDTDRNLYVDSISLNGQTVNGSEASVPAGFGQTVHSAELWTNSSAVFHLNDLHNGTLVA